MSDYEETIDRSALDMIRGLEINGKTGVLRRVLGIFLRDSPKLIEKIRQGIVTDDSVAAYQAAHTLKSSSAIFGAMKFAELCKVMEMMGRTNTLENAEILLRQIESEYVLLQDHLKHELENSSV